MTPLGRCYHCEGPVFREDFTSAEALGAFEATRHLMVEELDRHFRGNPGACQVCWDRGERGKP